MAREGRTIVIATHFLGEAGRLATHMAVLHRGKLHAYGRPADLAADLWSGFRVEIDLGRPAADGEVAVVAALEGVTETEAAPIGMLASVEHRDTLPRVIAALVGHEVRVFGVSGAQSRPRGRVLSRSSPASPPMPATSRWYRSPGRTRIPRHRRRRSVVVDRGRDPAPTTAATAHGGGPNTPVATSTGTSSGP